MILTWHHSEPCLNLRNCRKRSLANLNLTLVLGWLKVVITIAQLSSLDLQARLGGEDIGSSFRRDLKLISEVQAPFRGVRRFFYVAFSAAAGISLFFTIPRLIRAINGGDGAPDLWDTAGNAAINIGGNHLAFLNYAESC